jgi:hypothetical protein
MLLCSVASPAAATVHSRHAASSVRRAFKNGAPCVDRGRESGTSERLPPLAMQPTVITLGDGPLRPLTDRLGVEAVVGPIVDPHGEQRLAVEATLHQPPGAVEERAGARSRSARRRRRHRTDQYGSLPVRGAGARSGAAQRQDPRSASPISGQAFTGTGGGDVRVLATKTNARRGISPGRAIDARSASLATPTSCGPACQAVPSDALNAPAGRARASGSRSHCGRPLDGPDGRPLARTRHSSSPHPEWKSTRNEALSSGGDPAGGREILWPQV